MSSVVVMELSLIDVLIARQFNDLIVLVHLTLYVSIKHPVCEDTK